MVGEDRRFGNNKPFGLQFLLKLSQNDGTYSFALVSF